MECYDSSSAAMLRIWILGMGLALCVSLILAQTPPSASAQAPSVPAKDACTVAGQVVRAATGEPLPRVQVTLFPADGPRYGASDPVRFEAQTDDAGHFTIEGISPGRYFLMVERRGYLTQYYGQTRSSETQAILTLASGERRPGLLFRMVPWSVISGRITDENGDPIPDVSVEALRSQFRNGKRTLSSEGDTQTNDLGEYRIWDLERGHYVVRAVYQGRWSKIRPKVTLAGAEPGAAAGYAPVFYPGTADATHAVALDVGDGQEMPGIDFVFLPTRAVRIRGHVFDAMLGRPASGCCVQLMPLDRESSSLSSDSGSLDGGKGGSFELQVTTPGPYEVLAFLRSSSGVRSARRRIEVGGADIDGIDMTVSRGVEVRGRVIREDPGDTDLTGLSVRLGQDDMPISGPPAEVKADGTFLVNEVADGTYSIRLFGPLEGTFLKTVRSGGQDILESGLAIEAAAFKGPLEIILSGKVALVDGSVTDDDGLPMAGARVVLLPDQEKLRRHPFEKVTVTDQYGSFVIRDVRPGRYKAFAWREVDAGEWDDPDFMKPFGDKGVKIEPEENGHVTVQLKLLPEASNPKPPQ